jgi:hypothetical protein
MLSTSEETLDHALELSAALEASEAGIAAWRKFLAPQPKSLAAQAKRIMARAIAERDAAAAALGAFLAAHGISYALLDERRGLQDASKREAEPPATNPRAREPPAAAPGAPVLERMMEDWQLIAHYVPGLISPRVLKRARARANALLTAEKRLASAQNARARARHTSMSGYSRWRMKRAIVARDTAERSLYDYLARSGMYRRIHLAREYLMEAWKRTMQDAVQPEALPHLDVAAALAARVRAYLDHWAKEQAGKR